AVAGAVVAGFAAVAVAGAVASGFAAVAVAGAVVAGSPWLPDAARAAADACAELLLALLDPGVAFEFVTPADLPLPLDCADGVFALVPDEVATRLWAAAGDAITIVAMQAARIFRASGLPIGIRVMLQRLLTERLRVKATGSRAGRAPHLTGQASVHYPSLDSTALIMPCL
ncbi:MAG: hypothetical protein EXS03_09595, partial [Phycisphaerales bacterium]|nr:hypothetical protein [Phycisphaerales bacterium]